jgi:hypothetical protein
MSNMDATLVQYQVFAESRLHYGRMFWANIAFLIVVLIATFTLFQGDDFGGGPFVLVGAGIATLQMAYIAHRLKRLEDHYEALMHDLEVAMQARGEASIIIAPRSSRLSARTMTVWSLAALGVAFLVLGCALVVRMFPT